jgi:hypothetical protein
MDKTSRLKLIKKLVAKRAAEAMKVDLEFVSSDELYLSQVETTEKDVFDELSRLDSFAYTSNIPVEEDGE